MQISNSQCSLSKRHAWRLKRQWVNLSQGWLAHICSKQFAFSWLMGKLSLSLLHSLLSQATLPIVCQSYVHHRTARSHTQSGCYFNENYAESSSLIALISLVMIYSTLADAYIHILLFGCYDRCVAKKGSKTQYIMNLHVNFFFSFLRKNLCVN